TSLPPFGIKTRVAESRVRRCPTAASDLRTPHREKQGKLGIDRIRAGWQSPERRHGGLLYVTVLLNGRSGGHAGPCVLVSSRDWDVSRPVSRGGSVMEVPFGGWKAPRRTTGSVPEAYSGLSSAPPTMLRLPPGRPWVTAITSARIDR